MKRILLLLLTTFTLSCCNNDDDKPQNPIDQLPPATQTGANTFGCLINGEPFVVSNTSNQTAIYQGGVLQIGGGIDNSIMDKRISINISAPINLNTPYDLTLFPNNLAIFVNNGEGCYYDYDHTTSGTLTITKFDQTNFIISGTFNFSTQTNECENINITNGRFDLQYIP
jgi:predicted small secreted protein